MRRLIDRLGRNRRAWHYLIGLLTLAGCWSWFLLTPPLPAESNLTFHISGERIRSVHIDWDVGSGFQTRNSERHEVNPEGIYSIPIPRGTLLATKVRVIHETGSSPTIHGTWFWDAGLIRLEPQHAQIKRSLVLDDLPIMTFNGKDAFATVSDVSIPGSKNPFSVGCWFRMDREITERAQLLSQWNPQTPRESFFLGFHDKNYLCLSDGWQKCHRPVLQLGRLYHLVATVNEGVARCYIDGEATDGYSGLNFNSAGNLIIGRQGAYDDEHFAGSVGGIRVIPCQLTPAEVDEWFCQGDIDIGTRIENSHVTMHHVDISSIPASQRPSYIEMVWTDFPIAPAQAVDRLWIVSGFGAGTVLFVMLLVGVMFVLHLRALLQSRVFWMFVVVMSLHLIVSGSMILANYPGFWNIDELDCWAQAHNGKLHNIHPYFYIIQLAISARFWDDAAVVTISHAVLLAVTFAGFHAYAVQRGVPALFLLPTALISAIAIPVVVGNVYPQKDIIFTVLLWAQAFWLFDLFLHRQANTTSRVRVGMIVLAAFSLVWLIGTRHNAGIYCVMMPVLIVCFRLLNHTACLCYLTTLLIGWVFVIRLLPSWLGVQEYPPRFFEIMAMSNPLAAMADDRTYATLTTEEAAQLERLTGMTCAEMRSHYQSHDVNYIFFHPHFRRKLSEEEFRELKQFYINRLVIRRPQVLLADRTAMFAGVILSPASIGFDNLASDEDIHGLVNRHAWNVISTPRWPWAKGIYQGIATYAENHKFWLWNSGIGLLFLGAVMASYRHYPATALAGAIVFLQVPLLYIAMPMNYVKYVHFLYCVPMLLIPLLLTERHVTRPRNP